LDLDSLRLFRDIAQTRSFSKGAENNRISQSAASQQIQDLEAELGTLLLDRSTRPLEVTPTGELFAEYCRDVLRRRDEFEADLARLKHESGGEVRIASIYSIGLSEMAQIEREFASRRPQARLQVRYLRPEKVYAAVVDDEVDLGLVSYPEPSREIKVIPWRKEEMVLAAAPDHPLAKRAAVIAGPLPPAELNGIDFVEFDDDLPIRREIDRFFRDLNIEVKETVHFDNVQMVKEAVALKAGVSLLPARILRDDIRQRRITAIRLAGAQLYRPLGIIHRKKKHFRQVVQAFLDLLREKPAPEPAAL
jgi:LysR family transcriptional regulator, transcriptional activator of the cysJI operon